MIDLDEKDLAYWIKAVELAAAGFHRGELETEEYVFFADWWVDLVRYEANGYEVRS